MDRTRSEQTDIQGDSCISPKFVCGGINVAAVYNMTKCQL